IKQFMDCVKVPFVWYQLDSFDNDPVKFFEYLVKGLVTALPDFRVILPEFNPEDIKADKKFYRLMVSIINELENKANNGLIIVFDDLHSLKETDVLEFIEYFISYIPSTVHVIISCRYQPNFYLLNLKASGSIVEINQQDLKFTSTETTMLFNVTDECCFDEEYLAAVHGKLSGWALGLKLFKLAFRDALDQSTDTALLKAKHEIFDNIFNELYMGLPPEIQKFLRYTSVLENMTPGACNYMLEIQDAGKKLKYIEKKNLFITVTGSGDKISYRYHDVFKEYLVSLIENKNEVYAKAGHYYLQSASNEQAVECFRLANHDFMLIKAIEQTGEQMLQQGRLKTVEAWLSVLEERGLLNSPVLIMLKVELLSYSGSFGEAGDWINQAFNLFKETGDKERLVRTAIHKARILRYRVSFSESTKFIDRFMEATEEIPDMYRLEIAAEKVYNQWLTGNITAAIETAKLALSHKESRKNEKAAARLSKYMAVLYSLRGSYSTALELYQQILDSCQGNEDTLEQGSIPLYMSCIYRERGDPARALDMMKRSLDRKQRVGFTEDLHLIYFNIAITLLGYGELREIDHYCRLAQDAFKQAGGQLTYYEMMLKAFQSAILTYFKGEASQEAESLMEKTVSTLNNESKYLLVYITSYFVIYYLKYKQHEKANGLLKLVLAVEEASGLKSQVAILYGLKAVVLKEKGDQKGAIAFTKQSLELAAAERYERFFLTFPELFPCLETAFVNGIEQEFVEKIISRFDARFMPLLLNLLKHPDTKVRGKVVKLIKSGNYGPIRKEIELLFFDPDIRVRDTGFALLKEMAAEEEQRTKLFIRCLGNLKVYRYDDWNNPLVWRTSKAKELFAYLLHWQEQPVLTERILADLWPDTNIDKARNLFHTNLTHVKKLLKQCGLKDNLQKHQTGYALAARGMVCDLWLPNVGGCSGVYLEDIYSDWPEVRRLELEQ
ncbi:hypothetical protein, partial [Desulfotomaculum sp. 1211_IL3151]|uniref:hypothetical protein n=1 Tax=Desulfotomaculum sp. 1211_IL3151 TaxID=3084055 RepID=UPI002FDAF011